MSLNRSLTPVEFGRIFSGLALVALAALATAGCSAPPPAPPPAAIHVVSATPVKTSIVEWDEYVGRLAPTDFVEVRARVSGHLNSTHFDEGQIVKEGDLLCVIDPRPFAAEVARAEANVAKAVSDVAQAKASVLDAAAAVHVAQSRADLADKQLARSRKLVAEKAMSQEDFDVRDSEVSQTHANIEAAEARLEVAKTATSSAEAFAESARADLETARLNLEYTEVRAPITGRVSSRLVTEGNLIAGGSTGSTLITTLVSLDPIHLYFDADEQAFLKYTRLSQEGKRPSSREAKNPVYMALGDETTFPHRGHMDFVDNRLDPATGTIRGRAILPNHDLSLTPGMFVRLRLPGSGKYESVLVPDLAIGTDQSDKFVFTIDHENKIQRTVVELGPIVRGLRVVRKGLKGDEKIVVRGLQRVRPGVEVQATDEAIAMTDDGLPENAEPVPQEEWLSRPRRDLAASRRAVQAEQAGGATIIPAAMRTVSDGRPAIE